MQSIHHGVSRRTLLQIAMASGALSLGPVGAAFGQTNSLVYIDGAGIDVLDPGLSASRTAETVSALIFNRLVRWKDTQLSGVEGDLAESWKVSDDGLTWTFKLRNGVKFHDGTACDAAAIKFNLDRLRDTAYGSPSRSVFAPISRIDAPDAATVVIVTEAPYASLLPALAEFAASISSPTAVGKFGRDYGRHPVGSGPYELDEWVPGEFIKVRASNGYFGEKPRFQTILVRAVPESGARMIELETGNADIVNLVPPEAAARVSARGVNRLVSLPSTMQAMMLFNTKRAPFDNPKLRMALNYAIDRKTIVEKILGGFASVPDSYLTPGCQSYVSFGEHKYDPDLAKKLFAEAYPNGYADPIVIWTPRGRYLKDKEVAEAVQGYVAALGLKTQFQVFEWASYLQGVSRKQEGGGTQFGSNASNMYLLGTSIPVADWRFDRWFGTGKGLNWSGFSSDKADELIAKARVSIDDAARNKLYEQLGKMLWDEEVPALALYNQKQLIGLNSTVKEFEAFAYEVPKLMDVVKS